MSTSYRIPLHICQWCYKKPGNLLIDCLCIVCKQCFQHKKQWFSQIGKCFCCQKITLRKCLDLRANPQQGRMYFHSFQDITKINQFQIEASKKYCKHLQKKLKQYESIINGFLKQFPQYSQYFQKSFAQLRTQQLKSVRSKSSETYVQDPKINPHILYPSYTQKNMMVRTNFQGQNHQIHQDDTQNNKYKAKLPNHQNSKKSYQHSITSKKSLFEQNREQAFPAQRNRLMSMKGSQIGYQTRNFQQKYQESYKMLNNRNNIQKKSVQLPFHRNQSVPIYKLKQNQKLSDPSNRQAQLSGIHIQTALRSIRSQHENNNLIQQFPYKQSHMQRQFNIKQRRFPK